MVQPYSWRNPCWWLCCRCNNNNSVGPKLDTGDVDVVGRCDDDDDNESSDDTSFIFIAKFIGIGVLLVPVLAVPLSRWLESVTEGCWGWLDVSIHKRVVAVVVVSTNSGGTIRCSRGECLTVDTTVVNANDGDDDDMKNIDDCSSTRSTTHICDGMVEEKDFIRWESFDEMYLVM